MNQVEEFLEDALHFEQLYRDCAKTGDLQTAAVMKRQMEAAFNDALEAERGRL